MTGARGLDVGHRNRLAASGVVRDGDHHQRNLRRAFGFDELLQSFDIQVAFEGKARLCVGGGRERQVHGAGALEFDIGACGVEVRVVRHDVAGLAKDREQNPLGRSALVRGNDVAEPGERAHRLFEAVEAFAAGVGFVAAHHGRPLFGGHGAGSGIGQQVDQNLAGADLEQIVAGGFEKPLGVRRAWFSAAVRHS